MSTFAENLRAAMEEKQITQSELCKRTGISKSFVSQYLSGKFKPREDKLTLLAQALDTTKGRLMGYESPRTSKGCETDNLIKVNVYSADEPDNPWSTVYITAEPGEYVYYICRDDKNRPFVMSGDYLLVSVGEIGKAGLYAVKKGESSKVYFRELEDPRQETGLTVIGRVCEIRRKL